MKALLLFVVLSAGAALAQTTVKADQGRPGTQGAWPVTLSGGSDGGTVIYTKEATHVGCVNTTMNVGTTGTACPASQSATRSTIYISLNQSGETLRIRTDGSTATSVTGIPIINGQSYTDNLSSTVAPSCRCSAATCEVNIAECP